MGWYPIPPPLRAPARVTKQSKAKPAAWLSAAQRAGSLLVVLLLQQMAFITQGSVTRWAAAQGADTFDCLMCHWDQLPLCFLASIFSVSGASHLLVTGKSSAADLSVTVAAPKEDNGTQSYCRYPPPLNSPAFAMSAVRRALLLATTPACSLTVATMPASSTLALLAASCSSRVSAACDAPGGTRHMGTHVESPSQSGAATASGVPAQVPSLSTASTSASTAVASASRPATSSSLYLPQHLLLRPQSPAPAAVSGTGLYSKHSSALQLGTPGYISAPGQSRTLFGGFLGGSPPESKRWQQRRLVGWTPEQFYTVVSDVEQYRHFVPWCRKSEVLRRTSEHTMEAELEVGFQLLVERYTSKVTFEKPRLVRSCVSNSMLFHHLNSDWIMDPGPAPRTCWLNFKVDFAFNSAMYGGIADMFFNQVVKEMTGAFEGRCAKLYGPSSLIKTGSRAGTH